MISDLTFCNQVRQQTSHSFRFEDSYDFLCYKFYLQDIEEQNIRLKTEPPVETSTEYIKPLIETRFPIKCLEYESRGITSIVSTPTFDIEKHSETEESLEDSFDEDERTGKSHTAEKHFCDSRSDASIIFNASHTEILSKHFEEESIDKNLHFHFELITEPSDSTEETKSNGDTFAEEHSNDTEIENADQRRQSNLEKNSLLDKKESTLNFAVDCPDMLNHDELKQEIEFD